MSKFKTVLFTVSAAALAMFSALFYFGGSGAQYVSADSLKPNTHEFAAVSSYTVYVCGAVVNEGFYEVPCGETYFYAIELAGLAEESYILDWQYGIMSSDCKVIAVCYAENGQIRYPVNVNGIADMPDGIGEAVGVYRKIKGKITDKSVLREILGEKYSFCYYKIYVDAADYEKAD